MIWEGGVRAAFQVRTDPVPSVCRVGKNLLKKSKTKKDGEKITFYPFRL